MRGLRDNTHIRPQYAHVHIYTADKQLTCILTQRHTLGRYHKTCCTYGNISTQATTRQLMHTHTYGCSVTGHNNIQHNKCFSLCLCLYFVYFRLHLPSLTLFLTVLTIVPLAVSFSNTQTCLWLNSTLTFCKMSPILTPCQLLTYTHWSLQVYYKLNTHIQKTTVQSCVPVLCLLFCVLTSV